MPFRLSSFVSTLDLVRPRFSPVVVPTPVFGDSLVDAIEYQLTENFVQPTPILISASGPGQSQATSPTQALPLTWFGAGLAPADQPLPYASYSEPTEDDSPWSTSGDKQAMGTFQVQVFAANKKQARSLGDQVEHFLVSTAAGGGLAFAGGYLFRFRQSGRAPLTLDPDPAENGGPCWIETRQFEYRYIYD